jgi:autoinducer 2-degrading protein
LTKKEDLVATNDEVAWLFELEIQPGRREELEALIPEMLESTEASEPGSRAYQFFINDEGTTMLAYERYVDSDAALAHMAGFGEKFAARFMELVKPGGFTVLGSPSDQLMETLRPLGASVHTPAGGYCK